ncbi:MAG: 5-formyltetrahydrofolate cyclo-ligase [Actinomycetota bacterium]
MTGNKAIRRAKTELRTRMKQVREQIPSDERARLAVLVADRLIGVLADIDTVMTFLSFGNELPTDQIAERLHAAGKRLAVPHVDGETIVPLEYVPGDPVEEAVFGIREPAEHRPVPHAEIGAVIVPGLAFDRGGYRVGYGGGFYDRLLRSVPVSALRVGICFRAQVVEEVPRGHLDEALDLVVTDGETIECHRGGGADEGGA